MGKVVRDKREILEAIERLGVIAPPQDLGFLALTYLGVKPTCTIEIGYSEADPFSSEEEFEERQQLFEGVLKQAELVWHKIVEGRESNGFDTIYAHYFIGQKRNSVHWLVQVCTSGQIAEIGKCLGYPVSAAEACGKGVQYLIEAYAIRDLLKQEEFERLYELGVFNFWPFLPSRAAWQEETKVAEEWTTLLREYTPRLYQEIKDGDPHSLKTQEEYMAQWSPSAAQAHYQNVAEQIAILGENAVAESMKEMVVLLNGLQIRAIEAMEKSASVLVRPKPLKNVIKAQAQCNCMEACVQELIRRFLSTDAGVGVKALEVRKGELEFTLTGSLEEMLAFTGFLRANFEDFLINGYL